MVVLYSSLSWAARDLHRLDFPVYKSPEIHLTDKSINVVTLAKDISTQLDNIGASKIVYAGDLLRNEDFLAYLNWYSNNFHPDSKVEYLKPRSKKVIEILKKNWGVYIVHLHRWQNQRFITVFCDARREPVLISQLSPGESLTEWSQSSLFKEKPRRRLTESEREAERLRPEESYYAPLRLDKFVSLGMGQHHSLSYSDPQPFGNFDGNNFNDSADIYRWAKINSPMYRLNLGFLYEEMLGAGIAFNYSNLYMNYDASTTPNMAHWFYNRYEFGIFGTLGKSYSLAGDWNIYPHLYIGFQYAVFDEQFKINTPNLRAQERIKIPTLTGATGALGLKLMFKNQVGLDLSYGLTHVSGKSPENFQSTGNTQASTFRPPASRLNEHWYMIQLVWNTRTLY